MSTIQTFKANLINGGFRPNQFKCHIDFPTIIQGAAAVGRQVEFLAKSSQLPASSIAPVEVNYRGRPVKFAGERTFQPWSMDIYTDTDFNLRSIFEQWIEVMQNAASTGGAVQPALYQGQMDITAMDRNDNEVKRYTFIDAFPTDVGAMQVDWDSNNQIGLFTVTFDYNYFVAE